MEAGRVGGGEAKQQGAKDWDEWGSRGRRSPVWRHDQKSKTKPLLRGKKLAEGGPPVGRGSPFVVIRPGVTPPVGRRWAVVVLRPKIILGLTGTGLLMEAATGRKRKGC